MCELFEALVLSFEPSFPASLFADVLEDSPDADDAPLVELWLPAGPNPPLFAVGVYQPEHEVVGLAVLDGGPKGRANRLPVVGVVVLQ